MNSKYEKEEEKIKVAWYENNMQFVDPILYYLEKEQVFDVKAFGDPNSAEEKIVNYRPDLVIFDYRMPNINGVEMFKRLKDKFSFVPVFFSIWAKDDSAHSDIIDAGIEGEAIFDKNIEPDSFTKRLYEYYMKKKVKNIK